MHELFDTSKAFALVSPSATDGTAAWLARCERSQADSAQAQLPLGMITVHVFTREGHTWATSFNGTPEEAARYFVGQCFDVGHPEGPEKSVTVSHIRVNGIAH